MKNGEKEVNHKSPVVSTKEGFTNFDDFIKRLFCEENGFEILCISCHEEVTKKQNEERKQ